MMPSSVRSTRAIAPRNRRFSGTGSQPGKGTSRLTLAVKFTSKVSIARAISAAPPGDVGAEEGLGDDLQGQPHHVGLNVAPLAVGPTAHHTLRIRHHNVSIRCDPLSVKRRLREPTLATPELPLAGQEPRAQGRPGRPKREVLGELPVLADQDVLDQFGMVQGPDPPRAQPDRDHVAVVTGAAGEERQAIGLERAEVAGQPVPGRAGGGAARRGRRGETGRRLDRGHEAIPCVEGPRVDPIGRDSDRADRIASSKRDALRSPLDDQPSSGVLGGPLWRLGLH